MLDNINEEALLAICENTRWDESPIEAYENDNMVEQLLGYRTIMIANRTSDGKIIRNNPVQKLKINWVCPVCNKPMGEPVLISLTEDGITYTVSDWSMLCGHSINIMDLKEV